MANFKRTGSMHVPDVPDYFKYLRPDAMLSYADVAKLFWFTSANALGTMVSHGKFPRPDKHTRGLSAFMRAFWFKSTILAEIARRKQVRAELDAWLAGRDAQATITDGHAAGIPATPATTTEEI